jgi:hypothetical protein
MARAEKSLKEGSKNFFFEKKKQETFVYGGRWQRRQNGPQYQNFFASFFQKKSSYFA